MTPIYEEYLDLVPQPDRHKRGVQKATIKFILDELRREFLITHDLVGPFQFKQTEDEIKLEEYINDY